MKIIVDCDPGNGIPGANVDDAIALTFAARSPAFELAATWTVCGNTSASEGEEAAHRLFADLNIEDVPIRRGWCHPMSGDSEAWRTRLDSPSQSPEVFPLWGTYSPPVRTGCTGQSTSGGGSTQAGDASSIDAREGTTSPTRFPSPSDALAADLRLAGEGTVLACLGPLTNVACLLRDRPEALRGVSRIVLMGGCLGYENLVDTNFAVDPQAARAVCASDIPLTIVPLDVTRTTELSPQKWASILAGVPENRRSDAESIDRWLTPWINYSTATRPVNGMWLHDVVVLAALAAPSLVTVSRERVLVASSPDGKLVHSPDGREVDVVTRVDNEGLIDLWARTVLGVPHS